MIKIIPSIASANMLFLHDEIQKIQFHTNLHIDIEDGNFVDNITFGRKTVNAISNQFGGAVDVHLMTTCPEQYIDWLADASVVQVCAHIEALHYPRRFLNHVHRLHMKAGLALNMKVNPAELESYLDVLDYVLVMTSEPDGEDQAFCSAALPRIMKVREMVCDKTEIWADGGITELHLPDLEKCGVSAAVMGRAVFQNDNPMEVIKKYERHTI